MVPNGERGSLRALAVKFGIAVVDRPEPVLGKGVILRAGIGLTDRSRTDHEQRLPPRRLERAAHHLRSVADLDVDAHQRGGDA